MDFRCILTCWKTINHTVAMVLLWCCFTVHLIVYILLVDLVCILNTSIVRSKEELLTIVSLWCCYGIATRLSNYLSNCVCARCGLGGYSGVQSNKSKVETDCLLCCCYGSHLMVCVWRVGSAKMWGGLLSVQHSWLTQDIAR